MLWLYISHSTPLLTSRAPHCDLYRAYPHYISTHPLTTLPDEEQQLETLQMEILLMEIFHVMTWRYKKYNFGYCFITLSGVLTFLSFCVSLQLCNRGTFFRAFLGCSKIIPGKFRLSLNNYVFSEKCMCLLGTF